ncbi:MAG: B12-binding domain-containing radical SAM protein [Deltaproteobacteria bacterium]|nr:B12-binding domain-containing radical SAM protein [Deltaproteobacteria bacterium]
MEQMERPPSALLYVGGFLRRHGFGVAVHHIAQRQMPETARAIATDPDLLWVGLSAMTGTQVTRSAELSRAVKALRPGATVVWGGVHPSLMPAECLAFGYVDYVVIGEGERTALDLSAHLAAGGRRKPADIPGLAYLDGDGRLHRTPDRPLERNLDDFRQDWSLVDARRYLVPYADGRGVYFISSRGCPHDCAFCYNLAFNHRRWRTHSVDFVVDELAALKAAHGIKYVVFDDDNFFANRSRALELLRRLKALEITVTWLELRIDYITAELMAELSGLGVGSVFFGWESGSDRTLSRISKGFGRDIIVEKMALLGSYPQLLVDASAIVGFPWETEADVSATVATALEMFRRKPFGVNFNLGLYVPYPGTPLVPEALASGFRFPTDPEGWERFDILSGEMRVPWLTLEQIRRYHLLDRFAKVLYVPGKAPLPLRLPAYAAALLAYARLHQGVLGLAVEPWLRARAERFWLERRQRRLAQRSSTDGSRVSPT